MHLFSVQLYKISPISTVVTSSYAIMTQCEYQHIKSYIELNLTMYFSLHEIKDVFLNGNIQL